MEVIVFTNNGKTLIFNNVSKLHPESSGFSFEYLGKSTNKTRTAHFNNMSTAGYVVSNEK